MILEELSQRGRIGKQVGQCAFGQRGEGLFARRKDGERAVAAQRVSKPCCLQCLRQGRECTRCRDRICQIERAVDDCLRRGSRRLGGRFRGSLFRGFFGRRRVEHGVDGVHDAIHRLEIGGRHGSTIDGHFAIPNFDRNRRTL